MIKLLANKRNEIRLYLMRKGIQKADADEIYSQICLTILETKPIIENFEEWITNILRNKIKTYKINRNKEKFEGDISLEQLQEKGNDPTESTDPKKQLEDDELQQLRQEKVNNLTKQQKRYYELFQQNLTIEEIAKEMNVQHIARVYDMKEKLKNLLAVEE